MCIDQWHFDDEDEAFERRFLKALDEADKKRDLLEFEAYLSECDLDDDEQNVAQFENWRGNLDEPVWQALGYQSLDEMAEVYYGT